MEKYKDSKLFMAHYNEGKYQQPSTVLNEDPAPEYFLAWARFIFSLYCGGGAATMPDGLFNTRSYDEIKSYAEGRQSPEKYKKLIDVSLKEGKIVDGQSSLQGGSLLNISWDNVMIYPKYRTLASTKAAGVDFGVKIRAIDTKSAFDRRKMYNKAKLSVDPRMKELFATANVMPEGQDQLEYSSKEEIDMAMDTGAFALPFEIMMEDVVGCTLDLSEWDSITQQLIEDQIDFNKMCWIIEADKTQNILKVNYLDPQGLIVPVSKYRDHRTDTFRAHIERTNIANLRVMSGLDEKELWSIAKRYSGFGQNAQSKAMYGDNMASLAWRQDYFQNNRQQVYDHFGVDVMTFYFIACKVESYIVGTNPDGSKFCRCVPGEYEMSEEEQFIGSQKNTNHVQYVYRGKWVVGTDIIFDYGIDDTIVREGAHGSKQAVIPIMAWTDNASSITERCISSIDDLQIAFFKIRLLIANLPPGPRFALDMSVLDDSVEMSNNTYDMKSLLKLFGATGKLLLRSRSEHGMDSGSNKRPIMDVPVDVQSDFNLFSAQIVAALDMIRQSTGLNEISDGTGNPRDVLNKVAAGYQAASNNALSNITDAMNSVYKMTAKVIVKKYQSMALYGSISIKNWPVDANTLATITLPDDIHLYNFDIAVEMLPSDEDIALITNDVFQKQMEQKVSEADVFAILNMLRNKDIKKAQAYLSRAVAKGEAAAHARQVDLIQAQAKANAESAQASEAAKQQTVGAEFESSFKLNEQKAMIDEKVRSDEFMRKKALLDHEHSLGMTADFAKSVTSAAVSPNQ